MSNCLFIIFDLGITSRQRDVDARVHRGERRWRK